MEARGNETLSGKYQTNFIWGDGSPVNSITYQDPFPYTANNIDMSGCYHVYMAEWTPTAINYYFDGKKIHTTTKDVDKIHSRTHRIILNLAVGGDFIRTDPNNPKLNEIDFGPTNTRIMYVDYVKVFEK